ncbi:MAG: DUF3878 family protein [Clostridia bacterium]|nr:DUF3878 family protein [Clostridia bacterium]
MSILTIDATAGSIAKEKAAALKMLVEAVVFPQWENTEGGMEMILLDNTAVYRKIRFTDCSAGGELMGREIENASLTYSETQNKYTLALETKEGNYYLRFGDILFTKTVCYDLTSTQFYRGNPWIYLSHIAFMICCKREYAPDTLNEKETALLPLLEEIQQTFNVRAENTYEFSLLHKMAEERGYTELKKRFDKVKTARIKEIALAELTNVLSFIKYKPLWDEIYNAVKESQSEYEPYILTDRSHEKVIDAVMKERGFCGTYPDYVKVSATKGIINESSYGEIYTITKEKNAVCRVRCQEIGEDDGEKQIVFLCGTAFLKEGAPAEDADIYYCAFNAKGKALINTVECNMESKDEIKKCALIAAKRAERIKLTKAEKQHQKSNAPSFLSSFLPVFILGGGFFSIAFTLISLIIVVITALAAGESVGEFLRDMPWLFIVLFTWIGFGGAMGIITALSNRK